MLLTASYILGYQKHLLPRGHAEMRHSYIPKLERLQAASKAKPATFKMKAVFAALIIFVAYIIPTC